MPYILSLQIRHAIDLERPLDSGNAGKNLFIIDCVENGLAVVVVDSIDQSCIQPIQVVLLREGKVMRNAGEHIADLRR